MEISTHKIETDGSKIKIHKKLNNLNEVFTFFYCFVLTIGSLGFAIGGFYVLSKSADISFTTALIFFFSCSAILFGMELAWTTNKKEY